MSTKIYHGYISKLNIENLLKQFVSHVQNFEALKHDLYYKSLAQEATFEIDKNKNCDQYRIIRKVHDNNIEKVKKAISMGTREDNDLSCRCSVFPMGKNKTLILFYCEEKGMTDFWESLQFISEYHYQNSTDKPDYISTKDWNQRRRDWDKAIGNDLPSRRAYSFEFTYEKLPFRTNCSECLKHIPSKKERALESLYDSYTKKQFKRLKTLHKPGNDDLISVFNMARDNWFKYKKTVAYKKALHSVEKNLVKITFEENPIKPSKTSTKK